MRQQGRATGVVDREVAAAKEVFAKEVTKQRKEHWNQFLDKPTNVWKVAKYLDSDGQATFFPIRRIARIKHTVDSEAGSRE